jgi:hypothetical protein
MSHPPVRQIPFIDNGQFVFTQANVYDHILEVWGPDLGGASPEQVEQSTNNAGRMHFVNNTRIDWLLQDFSRLNEKVQADMTPQMGRYAEECSNILWSIQEFRLHNNRIYDFQRAAIALLNRQRYV